MFLSVRISDLSPLDVIDFMLETSFKQQKFGEFLPQADQYAEAKSLDDLYVNKGKSSAQNKAKRQSESPYSSKNVDDSEKANICEKNVIYYKFNSSNEVENHEKLSWDWMTRNTKGDNSPDNVTSSISFR